MRRGPAEVDVDDDDRNQDCDHVQNELEESCNRFEIFELVTVSSRYLAI